MYSRHYLTEISTRIQARISQKRKIFFQLFFIFSLSPEIFFTFSKTKLAS